MDSKSQSRSQPAGFFPGLERHLDALNTRLEAGEKTICLRGVAGVGKSSLVRVLAERFAGAHGAESVLQLWLDPLGVPGISGEAAYPLHNGGRLPEPLQERLANPNLLVVLDGFNRARNAVSVWRAVSAAAAGQAVCALDALDETACGGVFELGELAPGEASALLMLNLARRGYNLTLPVGFLDRVYQAAGGLPLALRLIAGQVGRVSPERLLQGLYEGRLTSVEAFYTILLWRAWELLSPDAKKLLVALLSSGYNEPQERPERERLSQHRGEQAWFEARSLGLVETSGLPLHPTVWKFVYFRSLDT